MFNGIIFKQGIVSQILKSSKGINIFLKTSFKITKKDIGMSISCDGACLTLVNVKNKLLEFYLSNETINRSKFKTIKIGEKINLELPLKYRQKISGHFCQGHIDAVAKLKSKKKIGKSFLLEFMINNKYKKNLVEKASILINGVSLTISKITKKGFQIWVIPHTIKLTNLVTIKKNNLANVEIDILSKYVKNYLNEK